MSKTILLVDDDKEVLEMTGDLLSRRGFDVVPMTNAAEALTFLSRERPDIILADVLMPEMDGYTFYKALKRDPATADIPVLIITGRGQMEDTFSIMGVDGFVSKPFAPEALVKEVEEILNRAGVRRESEAVGAGRKKVVVIGSHSGIIRKMHSQAQQTSFRAESSLTGADAMSTVIKFLPQLIFVDIHLKDMDAGEWVDALRRLAQFQRTPVIGYCYYEAGQLGDDEIRKEVLNIEKTADQFLKKGGTYFMGRYNPQAFLENLLKYSQTT